ncbi:hypothetical protein ARTHRO9AX_10344 [Arthrobacter sp. 9AX]|nr:hypothetical protein ARTHRO9AX_10344 [Arthrobacter sp. 9AX]
MRLNSPALLKAAAWSHRANLRGARPRKRGPSMTSRTQLLDSVILGHGERARFISCHGRQAAFDRRGCDRGIESVRQHATEDREHVGFVTKQRPTSFTAAANSDILHEIAEEREYLRVVKPADGRNPIGQQMSRRPKGLLRLTLVQEKRN